MNSDYLTVPDAAALLGYAPQHVNLLIREGKLKAERFGHGKTTPNYITLASLRAYQEELKNHPKEPYRCEPCDHSKKRCLKCQKMVCLNDFYTANKMLNTKRPYCKNCELARKRRKKQSHT